MEHAFCGRRTCTDKPLRCPESPVLWKRIKQEPESIGAAVMEHHGLVD